MRAPNVDLVIVASGKSLRFGGFPKAFFEFNGEKIVERNIETFKNYVNNIYMFVNPEIYKHYNGSVEGCEFICIETGYGDAHSLLRGLKKISGKTFKNILVCWGDILFRSEIPIIELLSAADRLEVNDIGVCLCAFDKKPYAWFDIKDDIIIKSYFASKDGEKEEGLHDQCLFFLKTRDIVELLEEYKLKLGINEEKNTFQKEMKLLYAFEFFYSKGRPMKVCITKPGNVLSFNTKQELYEKIGEFNKCQGE